MDISGKNFKEASRQLAIVLEFEPNNVYATEMRRKIDWQISEIENEILKTVKIVEVQPNWKEAWIKLALSGSIRITVNTMAKADLKNIGQ